MDSSTKYAEYKIIAVNADGSPVCECKQCHELAMVQYQQPLTFRLKPIYLMDCRNPKCNYFMVTGAVYNDDVKIDGVIEIAIRDLSAKKQ